MVLERGDKIRRVTGAIDDKIAAVVLPDEMNMSSKVLICGI